MGGPALIVFCARPDPEPEAWHAPFCSAARLLKMRILPPMGIGSVHLVAPGAGGVIGRRARVRGKNSCYWKSPILEDKATSPPSLPVFPFFPLPTLYSNKKKATQRTIHCINICPRESGRQQKIRGQSHG